MTMLDRRPDTIYKQPETLSAPSQTPYRELSEADIMRGWSRYFTANPVHPDVQAQVKKVMAADPWKPVSPEDTVWAVGQAAMARATSGELPPLPEPTLNSPDISIE